MLDAIVSATLLDFQPLLLMPSVKGEFNTPIKSKVVYLKSWNIIKRFHAEVFSFLLYSFHRISGRMKVPYVKVAVFVIVVFVNAFSVMLVFISAA